MANIAFLSHLDLNLYLFRTPIIRALVSKGHKVYAVCPKGDKNEELRKLGAEVVNYEISRKSLNPFKEFVAIWNIYKAIKPLKLDLLHTFTAKPNIYGSVAGRMAGVGTIINLVEGLGSFYVEDSFKNRLVRGVMECLYKVAFMLSKKTIFVNSDDPAYMIKKGIINANKAQIIESVGVDTSVFDMLHVEQKKQEALKTSLHVKPLVVLMVARAIWHKGIREYYEAALALSKKYSNVSFLLVGGTDEGNHSCAPVEFLKNGAVLWLGQRDDVVELTALCDIYVLPSYREGVPRTLLEAASMSKPIVTTDTVGCREVVKDGENGFLVAVKDANELAEKISILIEDASLRVKMGENGRKIALEEFDERVVCEKYLNLYARYLDV